MENAQVADVFDEIADLMELGGDNPFRVRAYRNAARSVRSLSQRLEELVERQEDLTKLPNVGQSTAEQIPQILETGTSPRLREQQRKVPADLPELMRVPQLGPRRAMQIHVQLGVDDLGGLRWACEQHRVRELPGMGPKTEENILKGLDLVETTAGRFLYPVASDHANALGRHLDGIDAVTRWEVAGSLRRRQETIGDLDVLVEASDRERATEGLLEFRDIEEILSRGSEKVSVRLQSGLQIDFRFIQARAFGAALLYFTGSKPHNIALRRRAQARGCKLNEYGLSKNGRVLASKDEESIYRQLDLEWIPPELREERGELEAAERGELPELLELDQLRGDLHAHTDATDGSCSIEEMAQAARERGYEYLAITDHSKRVTMARGLDEDDLLRHADRIREVDARYADLWLMAGVEVDVLKSGKLDLDEDLLAELDWVVASTHYDTHLTERKMTERLLAAVRSGVVHALGHPMNRLIGKRESIRFDVERVFRACVDQGVRIEINSQPERLDLPDVYCRPARDAGAEFVVVTDAHRPDDFELLELGVQVARRGWLRRKDVLNTSTRKELARRIQRRS